MGKQVRVDVFSRAEAVRLLAERTGMAEDSMANDLAAELGDLALALAHASACIADQHLGFADYLQRLRSFPVEEHLPRDVGDSYPTSIAQAILLSAASVEQREATAQNILELLGILSPLGVPRQLLYGRPHESDRRAQIDRILGALASTSLISFEEDGKTVLMHRLTQRILRDRSRRSGRLEGAISAAAALLKAATAAIPERDWSPNARGVIESLINQIDALWAINDWRSQSRDEVLELRAWGGTRLVEIAKPSRAIPRLEALIADRDAVLGRYHHDTLPLYDNLAAAYGAVGDYEAASAAWYNAAMVCRRTFGINGAETLRRRHNHAYNLHPAGHSDRSIELMKEILAFREKILGPYHPDTLTSRAGLGSVYRSEGDLAGAIPLLSETLDVRERVLGPDHRDTLTSRHELAHAYHDFARARPNAGNPGLAVELFENVVAGRVIVLGDDHPDTLLSRARLGAAYVSSGDLGHAVVLFKRLLPECEQVLGPDHPTTKIVRENLAAVPAPEVAVSLKGKLSVRGLLKRWTRLAARRDGRAE
jgi:tetratricopeptide (TPR) repeat protein